MEPQLWWRPPGHTDTFTLIPHPQGTSAFHFVPFDSAQVAPDMMWKGHAIHADPPEPGTLPMVNSEGALETPRQTHEANVAEALNCIASGHLDKVVVSLSLIHI